MNMRSTNGQARIGGGAHEGERWSSKQVRYNIVLASGCSPWFRCTKLACQDIRFSRRRLSLLPLLPQLGFCLFWLSLILDSSWADNINSTYRISSNKNTETIEIGTTRTNNYNIHESNYQPTQVTQLVLNVPKPKKLRKSRSPNEHEYAIKRRILDVYQLAKQEVVVAVSTPTLECSTTVSNSPADSMGLTLRSDDPNDKSDNQLRPLAADGTDALSNHDGRRPEPAFLLHLNHLGRILKALNPKYIATERVRRVAFAEPDDLNALVPLPETLELPNKADSQPGDLHPLDSSRAGKPLLDQLSELAQQMTRQLTWTPAFIQELEVSAEESMNLDQLAFKRLILCMSRSKLCDIQQQQYQPTQSQRVTKLQDNHDSAQLAAQFVHDALHDVRHLVGESSEHQIYVRPDLEPDFKRGLKERVSKARRLATQQTTPSGEQDPIGQSDRHPLLETESEDINLTLNSIKSKMRSNGRILKRI